MPAQAPPAYAPRQDAPHAPQGRSMEGAVKAYAAVQVVFAVLALVLALLILFSGEFAARAIEEEGNEPEAADLVRSVLSVLGVALLLYAALGLVGAIGIFMLRGWGRGASLAFAGISLINIPFGTALGIWGLIVLTRPETSELFRQVPA